MQLSASFLAALAKLEKEPPMPCKGFLFLPFCTGSFAPATPNENGSPPLRGELPFLVRMIGLEGSQVLFRNLKWKCCKFISDR